MPFLQHLVYETTDSTKNLQLYANQMRKDGLLNDVSIKAGNEIIAAHRLVLSCHSKFFERMFQSQMREQYEDTVLIGNFDADVVKMLIEFIYVGKITIDHRNVFKLLTAADYLQLDEVKEFCFDFFPKGMTIDNCLDFVQAYNLYEPGSSLDYVYEFISENLEKITETGKLNWLSEKELISLLSNLNSKVKQSSIYEAVTSWVKDDQENRHGYFMSLFQLVDLCRLPCEFLEDVVAADQLVKENNVCINAVATQISKNFKEMRLKSTWIKESGSKIISIGGFSEKAVVEVSNIFGKSAMAYPDLPTTLSYHCALSVDNLVYCIGGLVDAELRSSTVKRDVYRLNLNKKILNWEKTPSMNQGRAYHSAAVLNENLVVAGGFIKWKNLDLVELYEAKLNKWRMLSPMNHSRSENALVACTGSLYVLGGVPIDNGSSVECLKELDGKWEDVAPMLSKRKCFAAVNYQGFIYAIGGRCGNNNKSTTKSVEKYNPVENKWTFVSNMNKARYRHSACVLHGRIFVVGGKDERDQEVAEVEWYDPAQNTWQRDANASYAVFGHSIVAV